ncbi:hypothetical protein P8452_33925 [Trifolium repens]|nr:hypothetical protein QL285_022986 [Trifolium repens]WJX47207.1 hypothetical protein P8452_33925 [Trifolium repens]
MVRTKTVARRNRRERKVKSSSSSQSSVHAEPSTANTPKDKGKSTSNPHSETLDEIPLRWVLPDSTEVLDFEQTTPVNQTPVNQKAEKSFPHNIFSDSDETSDSDESSESEKPPSPPLIRCRTRVKNEF